MLARRLVGDATRAGRGLEGPVLEGVEMVRLLGPFDLDSVEITCSSFFLKKN